MFKLWIFNPDNDIALGNNLRNFTPPRNAMLLREAGAMLPAWIAGDGDYLFSNNSTDNDWLQSMSTVLNKHLTLLSRDNIDKIESISPWGWSRAIANTLRQNGVSPNFLPSDEQIDKIRMLSHRRSSIVINQQFQLHGLNASIPVEFSDIQQLKYYLDTHHSAVVIKSPWSSSGRGVLYSDNTETSRLLNQAEGIIKNQGSILVEPKHKKIIDFAMLYQLKNGIAKYVGLSVFNTLTGGNYTGNIVASEQYLSNIITQYISPTYLNQLQNALEVILCDLVGNNYNGICGIDMMVYVDENGDYQIAPCIELNLRHTMGYVAHCLARDIIAPDTIAEMKVEYIGNNPAYTQQYLPPQFDSNKRLINGTLSLIPTNPHFAITLTTTP